MSRTLVSSYLLLGLVLVLERYPGLGRSRLRPDVLRDF